jgi:hypothetical protein
LQVFYSLKTPCVLNFFRCVESVQQCSAPAPAKPQTKKRQL